MYVDVCIYVNVSSHIHSDMYTYFHYAGVLHQIIGPWYEYIKSLACVLCCHSLCFRFQHNRPASLIIFELLLLPLVCDNLHMVATLPHPGAERRIQFRAIFGHFTHFHFALAYIIYVIPFEMGSQRLRNVSPLASEKWLCKRRLLTWTNMLNDSMELKGSAAALASANKLRQCSAVGVEFRPMRYLDIRMCSKSCVETPASPSWKAAFKLSTVQTGFY